MNAPLRLHNQPGSLRLEWPDGTRQELAHGLLRSQCPCAQCRAARLQGRIAAVQQGVRLLEINPQGYGVQLLFDDGHGRGIYPWALLRELCPPSS